MGRSWCGCQGKKEILGIYKIGLNNNLVLRFLARMIAFWEDVFYII